jgi:hypothetical protein
MAKKHTADLDPSEAPIISPVAFMLRLSTEDLELIGAAYLKDGYTHRSEWIRHRLREAAEGSLGRRK